MPIVEEGVIQVGKSSEKRPKPRPRQGLSQAPSHRSSNGESSQGSSASADTLAGPQQAATGGTKPPRNRPSGGKHAVTITNDNSDSDDSGNLEDDDEGDESREKCHICSSSIRIKALYPCKHVTCHKCALRTRALIRDNHCLFCRAEQKIIIMSNRLDMDYDDFAQEELRYSNKPLGILFDDEKTEAKVASLLSLRCRLKSCPKHHETFTKWKDLKRHMQEDHGKRYCDLCVTHLHVFPVEQNVYNREQLFKHENVGNRKQGFNGHPRCEYCNKRFYSNDDLMKHCVTDHEKCFVCEQIDPTAPPQFFRNYNALEEHFIREHFTCRVQSCVDEKFVVFRYKEELQRHMLEKHKEIIGKSKAARVIDTDLPSYRPNSNGTGRFASRLTTMPAEIGTTSSSSTARTPVQSNYSQAFPELGSARSLSTAPNTPPVREPGYVAAFHQNLPPQDATINNTGHRFEERAKILLQRQPEALAKFHSLNDAYKEKGSTLPAEQLVSEYTKLFKDTTDDQIEILIHEMADLMRPKNTNRANQLQEAADSWISTRPVRRPESTVAPNIGSTWLRNGGRAYLGRGGISSPENFPSLPTTTTPKPIGLARPTAGSGQPSTSSTSSASSSASSLTAHSVASSAARTVTGGLGAKTYTKRPANNSSSSLNSEKFPTLPGSSKPFKPLEPKAPVKSVWGSKPGEEQDQRTEGFSGENYSDSASDIGRDTGAKKKGKKKTLLYSFSTYK